MKTTTISNHIKRISLIFLFFVSIGFAYAQPPIQMYPPRTETAVLYIPSGQDFLLEQDFYIQDLPYLSMYDEKVLLIEMHVPGNMSLNIEVNALPAATFKAALLRTYSNLISYVERYCRFQHNTIYTNTTTILYFEVRYLPTAPAGKIPVKIKAEPK